MESPVRNIRNRVLVSIVVPVYNCGNSSCIEDLFKALQNQTYTNWELILCNDGSLDNTIEICKRIQRQDARVQVLDLPHRGVSSTRNSGIKQANGEWIAFVDADDLLTPSFLSVMVNVTGDEGVDLVCCSYMIVENAGASAYIYPNKTYIGDKDIAYLLTNTAFLNRCSPWARLYKKSVICDNAIRYNEQIEHSEDRLMLYEYLMHCKGITTISDIGYIYGSLSATSLKHKRHSAEKLQYRQYELTKAGCNLLRRFEIKANEAFYVYKNLYGLAIDTCRTLALEGNFKDAVSSVQLFVKEHIIGSNKNKGLNQDCINTIISNDVKFKLLINQNYSKFVRMCRKEEFVRRLKARVHDFIRGRGVAKQYNDFIKLI